MKLDFCGLIVDGLSFIYTDIFHMSSIFPQRIQKPERNDGRTQMVSDTLKEDPIGTDARAGVTPRQKRKGPRFIEDL